MCVSIMPGGAPGECSDPEGSEHELQLGQVAGVKVAHLPERAALEEVVGGAAIGFSEGGFPGNWSSCSIGIAKTYLF